MVTKPESDVVVITGASAGVGRAAAQAFAREGAKIGLLGRGREGLEAARHDVEAAGGKALVFPADVAFPDQMEAAAAAVERELGPIDIWVNNAMVSVFRVTMVQLPALNTPQFGWVKSQLPRKPQPVPPIFQPEVAAEAILWAACHDRREVYVGMSTVEAIVGDKIASRLLDHYLARTGFEAQQTDEPDDPNRPNNLWEPVPGDHGAHGRFDDRARDHSLQLWATTHQSWLALAGAAAILGIWYGHQKRREVVR